jgi:hypothetical protein
MQGRGGLWPSDCHSVPASEGCGMDSKGRPRKAWLKINAECIYKANDAALLQEDVTVSYKLEFTRVKTGTL